RLQLELEGVAEQGANMLLLRPLAGVGVAGKYPAGFRMHLRPGIVRPGRERQPASRAADATELDGGPFVVECEDRAEGGGNGVELRICIRQLLAIALVELDLETLRLGCAPCFGELVGRDVDADHVSTGAGGPQRDAARPAGDIEDTCSGIDRERIDDA